MTTDTRAQGGVAPARDRRPHRHRDRHLQGRRHDPAEHGDDARLRRHRRGRSRRRCCSALVREAADASASTASRSTATPRPTIPSCSIATQRAGHAPITSLGLGRRPRAARRGGRGLAAARAGHRARRRRRDQVHHRAGEGGRDEAECRLAAYAIAPLAAREDGVLRQRPQPRPHPGRGRLCRHRRPRPDSDRPLPRRRARRARGRPPPRLPRGGRPARDEAERDHGPRRPASRRRAEATVWTCDLSHDYVSINADYRS